MGSEDHAVLRNARREAVWIFGAWITATAYCCGYYALFGMSHPEQEQGLADLHPTMGMPSWFFWGVLMPWAACVIFTVWFAGFRMHDDDLGVDRSGLLQDEVRAGAIDE